MADALALGASVLVAWGFKSLLGHRDIPPVKKNLIRVLNLFDGLHRELIAIGLVCLCIFSLIESEKTNARFDRFHQNLVTACLARVQQIQLNVERERKLATEEAKSSDPAVRAGVAAHERFIAQQATAISVDCKSL